MIGAALMLTTTATAGPVDLAPTLVKGSRHSVEQVIGKRLPDPTGDGKLESTQTVTYLLEVTQGGRLGSDTLAATTSITRATNTETASGSPRVSFDSSAGAATTDEEQIVAVGVGHTWKAWVAGDGGVHVQQDRSGVEERAKAIGLPAQLQDLLLTGWTDEAMAATVRELLWEGSRDFHTVGDTWSDTHPGGASLVGAQGDVTRNWTFVELVGDVATLQATFTLPDSHVTQDGTCSLTLKSTLSGAPIERRTECTVKNASLNVTQDVWLTYTWSQG